MTGKTRANRIHAQRRADERYGVPLGRQGQRQIVAAIRAGRHRVVKQSSLTRAVCDVPHDGRIYRVVYDRSRKSIITFLPPEKSVPEPEPLDGPLLTGSAVTHQVQRRKLRKKLRAQGMAEAQIEERVAALRDHQRRSREARR